MILRIKFIFSLILLITPFTLFADDSLEEMSSDIIEYYKGWKGESEYEEARKYLYAIGRPVDISKGCELLKLSAGMDYPPALNLLGIARVHGWFDLFKRKTRGVNYWKIGAGLGDPHCAMNLSKFYLSEKNLDLDNAEEYLKQVRGTDGKYMDLLKYDVELRNYLKLQANALYLMGAVYKQRAINESDPNEKEAYEKRAFEYFIDADSEGSAEALIEIATAYAFGIGTERNFEKADYFIQRASEKEKLQKQELLYSLRDQNYIDHFHQYELQKEIDAQKDETVADYRITFADKIVEEIGDEIPIESALKWYELAAKGERGWAMVRLAHLYWDGVKVEKDAIKAFKWFKLSSDKIGYTTSHYNTGVLYRLGLGVEKDEALAKEYFKRGAAESYVSYLALEYPDEYGLEILTSEEAFDVCQRGVKQKDPYAQYCYAKRYENGFGVTLDYKNAHKYYKKAAKQGLKEAQYEYGKNLIYKDFGSKFDKALGWLEKAADQGHADACFLIAYLYDDDKIHSEDKYQKVYKYYNKCLKIDPLHPNALNNMGNLFDSGNFVMRDTDEANKYYEKAASLGNEYANYNLAQYKRYQKKYDEAIELYKKGAEKDHLKSILKLIKFYEEGKYLERDEYEVSYYTRQAALLGHKESIHNICYYYIYGISFSQNLDLALQWISFAQANNVSLDMSVIARVLLEKQMYDDATSFIKGLKRRGFDTTKGIAYYLEYLLYMDESYSKYNRKKARNALEKSIEYNYPPAVLKHGKRAFKSKQYELAYESFSRTYNDCKYTEDIEVTEAKYDALFNLGCMDLQGLGIEVDKKKGMYRIKTAARLGYDHACFAYALSYFKKMEFAPNKEDAMKYMRQAAENGHEQAIEFLRKLKDDEMKKQQKNNVPSPQGGGHGFASYFNPYVLGRSCCSC